MIIIKKSPTADSRTCDRKNTSKETLIKSTERHKLDVKLILNWITAKMDWVAKNHDNHKIKTMDVFHAAFTGGFADETWWNEHKKERHHLPANLDDVNLIDILENIADCVAAGMARTGSVFPLKIDDAVLQKAFQNTVKLLKENCQVED